MSWKWKVLSHVRLFVTPTGVGSLSLLQGIFPTQGLNPGLPHCRWILYLLSHQGSPRILEWVAYPFSSGSFRPRNWTGVSCIAGGFFTNELWGKPYTHTYIYMWNWITLLYTWNLIQYCKLPFVQSLSHVWLFATPWTTALQASLSFTISWSLLKRMPTESLMPSNHLILCRPFFSCPQSFPASGSFPVSPLLHLHYICIQSNPFLNNGKISERVL